MTPGRTDLAQAWTALRGLVLAKAVFHVEHPAARCRVAGLTTCGDVAAAVYDIESCRRRPESRGTHY